MKCTRCGICCQETDMLLSAEDIKRLEKHYHTKDTFVRTDNEGYKLLRNRQGHCVFYNPQQKRCNAYLLRPTGCRLYPVIYDEEKGIITDNICRAQETITEQEKTRKGKRVLKLLAKIDNEATERRKK